MFLNFIQKPQKRQLLWEEGSTEANQATKSSVVNMTGASMWAHSSANAVSQCWWFLKVFDK